MKNVVKGGKANSAASVADLGLELSADNVNVYAGEAVVFTIIVTNYGPDSATGVEVTDRLPNGYTHISSSTLWAVMTMVQVYGLSVL